MKTMTVKWEVKRGNPSRIIYFVNNSSVGEDDGGFDKILTMIKENRPTKVILKIERISALGGESLHNTFPFKERFSELKQALGGNELSYRFFK